MEHVKQHIEEIKVLSNQIIKIENDRNSLNEQLSVYKQTVSNYIHNFRRAESMFDTEFDPDILSLTETTNRRVQAMEDKIQNFYNDIEMLNIKYSELFEKRKVLVHRLDSELNKTIVYAYPFGTDSPTIRMGKYYSITNSGDIVCELVIESNSYFNKDEFHRVV